MKRLSSFIPFLALLVLSFGCGQKGKTTKANVTLVAGFAGVIPGQTGGTMVLGFNPRTGQSFSKAFDGAPIELPNGFWDFAAISWDGNAVGDVMQGQVRCAIARGVALNGGESNVSLNLSTPNCTEPLFGAKETKAANGEPLPILPVTCTDERGVYDSHDPANCKNSTSSSYQVIFPTKRLDGTPGAGLVSACVDEDTPTSAELDSATHAIKLPMVFPGPWEFPVVIDLFDGAGCSGARDRVVVFNVYSGEANRGSAQLNEQGSYAGVANELRISKNPCSSPVGLNATPFSPESGLFALCTPDQLDTFVEANLTQNYELYADLDFTGINFTDVAVVQGTFEGMFDGRGHTISNVTITQTATGPAALFRQLDGVGNFNNDDATVKDLHLSNFNFTTNGPSNGALTGNMLSGSQVSRVTASNVTITINGGADGTGGLIGKMLSNGSAGNSANTNDWSSVRGAKVDNVTIINISGQTDVGGMVGIIEDQNSIENAVARNVTLRSSATSARLGGAIGIATNGAQIRSVKASIVNLGTATNPLHTSTIAIGGLVGKTEEVEVYDSKADNVYLYGGNSKIGGLIGEALGTTVQNVVGDMDVIQIPSGGEIGGLIGYASNSAAPTDIQIMEARSFGSISCAAASCGGLIGTLYASTGATNIVAGSYSEANVSSTNNNVGGLIGQANNNASTINIIESAAFNTVSGATDVGGLVGQANAVDFVDSYAIANITGTGTTNGGFVGSMNAGSFTRCYAKPVLAASNANYEPFVNGFTSTPTVTDVYYVHPDTDSNIGGGTLLTVLESLTSGNFVNFDFSAAGPWLSDGSEAPDLKAIESFRALGGFDTGSEVDPILIESPAEWNSIGDKPQLMDKVYRLGNNIDFAFGTFKPIASSTNPFKGKLQGNNKTIMNINFVDTATGTEPVGLFRRIEVDPYNGPTEIEHENPFNYDDDYALIIRNVSISKGSGQFGQAGILAGVIADDGSANPMNGQFHDYNMSVKIGNIEIYDSYVYGGRQTTNSSTGGLAGIFLHTNGQSELRDVRIYNTTVDSEGLSNQGVGGLLGRIDGPLNATATPAFRQFDTFIMTNITVDGGGADNVGGIFGYMGNQTADWETFIVNNGTISGGARVGGIVGSMNNGNTIVQGSFSGSVTGTTLVGGINGTSNGGTIESFSANAVVTSSGVDAGCIIGRGTGLLTYVENSIGNCSSVTASSAASYMGNGVRTGGATNSIYTGPSDEVLGANYPFASAADYVNPTFLSTNLNAGDPWVFEPGQPPVPYWIIFPQALERD